MKKSLVIAIDGPSASRKARLAKKTAAKKNTKKSSKFITEKEADKMLKPYLLRMIKRIESGEEEVYSKEEFFKKLKE